MSFFSSGWDDVKPLPQDDGPNPVVTIAYSPQFVEAMNYFRAIIHKQELSKRALELTGRVIDFNSANYTAWHYRRLCLYALNLDLEAELQYVESIALKGPKNYQLWHHRRLLLDKLNKPLNDMQLTKTILNSDPKNYHSWSHRQWLLKRFNLFDGEMQYIDTLLDKDIRNNSAWNQRYFVITNTTSFTPQVITEQLQYVQKCIQKCANNQSPWNFLYGMMKESSLKELNLLESLESFALSIIHQSSGCIEAHSFLVEVYENMTIQWKSTIPKLNAIKVCNLLSSELDVIRSAYWKYRADKLESLPASSDQDDKHHTIHQTFNSTVRQKS